MSHIAAVVLAAGSSQRFGSPKQNALIGGIPMLSHILGILTEAGILSPIVVLGAHAKAVAAANYEALRGATVIENLRWNTGPGASLKAGVSALPLDAAGALVLLADQPLVKVAHLQGLIAVPSEAAATVTTSGVRSPPAYFPKRDFPALLTLDDHQGARELLNRSETILVCSDRAATDIDFADQLNSIS